MTKPNNNVIIWQASNGSQIPDYVSSTTLLKPPKDHSNSWPRLVSTHSRPKTTIRSNFVVRIISLSPFDELRLKRTLSRKRDEILEAELTGIKSGSRREVTTSRRRGHHEERIKKWEVLSPTLWPDRRSQPLKESCPPSQTKIRFSLEKNQRANSVWTILKSSTLLLQPNPSCPKVSTSKPVSISVTPLNQMSNPVREPRIANGTLYMANTLGNKGRNDRWTTC